MHIGVLKNSSRLILPWQLIANRASLFSYHILFFYKSAPPAKQNHTFRACQKSVESLRLWLPTWGPRWSIDDPLQISDYRLEASDYQFQAAHQCHFFVLLISPQQFASFIEINAFRASFLCSLLGVCAILKICVSYINSYCKRTLAPSKSARGWFYLGSW